MIIDFATLPIAIQEQIVKSEKPVVIAQNGKVVATLNPTPSHARGDFDYDLERMKVMMATEFKPIPKFDSDEEFLAWVNS